VLGSHLSIAGGMFHALASARTQNMDCVQIFTKNQRQWNAKPLSKDDVELWLLELKKNGWANSNRTVSHNSYLINMASPNETTWGKSIALQREEIERCERLGISLLVAHPGARLGTPRKRGEPNNLSGTISKEDQNGLQLIVAAIDQIHNELPGYKTITCLETTVGSGTNLGYNAHHLGWIRDNVSQPERIGFCFDTCHITAAGYDMTTKKKAEFVLQEFDEVLGLKHIKVFHFNDSVGPVGSRLDRHAHIGEGSCGLSCFKSILSNPLFDNIPKILETSKEENEAGQSMDQVNLTKLRSMAKSAKKNR